MVVLAHEGERDHCIHDKKNGEPAPSQPDELWECFTHTVQPNDYTTNGGSLFWSVVQRVSFFRPTFHFRPELGTESTCPYVTEEPLHPGVMLLRAGIGGR